MWAVSSACDSEREYNGSESGDSLLIFTHIVNQAPTHLAVAVRGAEYLTASKQNTKYTAFSFDYGMLVLCHCVDECLLCHKIYFDIVLHPSCFDDADDGVCILCKAFSSIITKIFNGTMVCTL